MDKGKYIIITPARNEASYIEKTINSVINQTVLPLRWIIVDDNSGDNTTEIVGKYLNRYSFIRLVKNVSEEKRNFGNKVYAIRRGFEEVKNIEYDYYCNLDADVSFEPNYFDTLLKKFEENPRLGICGGRVYDLLNGKLREQKSELHSVAGPVQFFRKKCYESFGGYQPSPIGFIDGYAELSARMNGWKTKTFDELTVYHHRPEGTHRGSKLKHCYEGGQIEYLFGYSYIYHIIRNLPRIFNKPFFMEYIATLAGYHCLLFKRKTRFVKQDFIHFVRIEQKKRILSSIKKYLKIKDK